MFSPRLNLFLAIAATLLLGLVFFDQTKWQPARQGEEMSQKKLLTEPLGATKQLEIISQQGPGEPQVLRFVCLETTKGCSTEAPGAWTLELPQKFSVDPTTIGSLLSALAAQTVVERIETSALAGSDWRKEFGLESPKLRVRISLQEETRAPVEIQFGETTPDAASTYTLVSSRPDSVFVVPQFLARAFVREPFHWRQKRLFPEVNSESVQTITWQHKQMGEMLTAKRAGQDWLLEPSAKSGRSIRADHLVISGLVAQVATWTAQADKGAVDFAKAQFVLRAKLNRGELPELTLEIRQSKTGEFWAKSSMIDWIAQVSEPEINKFVRARVDLRDLALLSRTEAEQVAKLELEFLEPAHKQAFILREGYWTAEGEGLDFSAEKIAGLFALWRAPETKSFREGNTPERSVLQRKLQQMYRFYSAEGKLLREFRVALPAQDMAIASGDHEGEVRVLSARMASLLPKTIQDLKNATPPAPVNKSTSK